VSFVAKVFVVFNFFISAVFLMFAANVWTAQTKWQKLYEREKKFNVEHEAEWQKNQVGLAKEVVKQQQIAQKRSEKIDGLAKQIASLQDADLASKAENVRLSNDRNIALARNEELERDKDRYNQELLKLKGVVVKQQQAVIVERDNAAKARQEKSEMENELNVTKQTLAAVNKDKRQIEDDLQTNARRLEKLIQLGVPVFSYLNEDPSATQAYVADAQVLAVRPDVGLVMISAGSQQNVKPGYQFTISRDADYVAKVQVEKVYPDMCSAKVVPGSSKPGMDIQVHDEARSR